MGALGGSYATRASQWLLTHVLSCGGMSKEAMRGSWVWSPLTDDDDTEVILLRFWCCVNIPEHSERDQLMNFLHDAGTRNIRCVAISYIFLKIH